MAYLEIRSETPFSSNSSFLTWYKTIRIVNFSSSLLTLIDNLKISSFIYPSLRERIKM